MSDEEKKRLAGHALFDALSKATAAAQDAGLPGAEIWEMVDDFYDSDFRKQTEIVEIPY